MRSTGEILREIEQQLWSCALTVAFSLAPPAAVVVGNTLTGDFTRANTLRLRWPYVARTLTKAALQTGMEAGTVQTLLAAAEGVFKSCFPPTTEDTLAGCLSNTIPGGQSEQPTKPTSHKTECRSCSKVH
jgi:hypothetical protein